MLRDLGKMGRCCGVLKALSCGVEAKGGRSLGFRVQGLGFRV